MGYRSCRAECAFEGQSRVMCACVVDKMSLGEAKVEVRRSLDTALKWQLELSGYSYGYLPHLLGHNLEIIKQPWNAGNTSPDPYSH
jgi:hypothetical protein